MNGPARDWPDHLKRCPRCSSDNTLALAGFRLVTRTTEVPNQLMPDELLRTVPVGAKLCRACGFRGAEYER